jgi:hypothetical protein
MVSKKGCNCSAFKCATHGVTRPTSVPKKMKREIFGSKKEAKGKRRRHLKVIVQSEEREYDGDDDDTGDDSEDDYGFVSWMKCNDAIYEDRAEVSDSNVIGSEDNDDFGSAFGIMRIFCDSQLHTTWYKLH